MIKLDSAPRLLTFSSGVYAGSCLGLIRPPPTFSLGPTSLVVPSLQSSSTLGPGSPNNRTLTHHTRPFHPEMEAWNRAHILVYAARASVY